MSAGPQTCMLVCIFVCVWGKKQSDIIHHHCASVVSLFAFWGFLCLEFTQSLACEEVPLTEQESLATPKAQLFQQPIYPAHMKLLFMFFFWMSICFINSCLLKEKLHPPWCHVNRYISGGDLWSRWTPPEPEPGPRLLRRWLKKGKAGDRRTLIRNGCDCESQGLLSTGKCLGHVVRFGCCKPPQCVSQWCMGCEENLWRWWWSLY